VGEAHYVVTWGKDFRKAWGDITTIRLPPKSTSFLAHPTTMLTDFLLHKVRWFLRINEALGDGTHHGSYPHLNPRADAVNSDHIDSVNIHVV
jgi:hypothetical protein